MAARHRKPGTPVAFEITEETWPLGSRSRGLHRRLRKEFKLDGPMTVKQINRELNRYSNEREGY